MQFDGEFPDNYSSYYLIKSKIHHHLRHQLILRYLRTLLSAVGQLLTQLQNYLLFFLALPPKLNSEPYQQIKEFRVTLVVEILLK